MGENPEPTSRKALLGPILAGFLLDLVDFATYGPIGLWFGALAGGVAGYVLAASMGVEASRRWSYAAVSGVYCMLPFTAFLPVATLMGALVHVRERTPPTPAPEGDAPVLEAEYRSRWDDGPGE